MTVDGSAPAEVLVEPSEVRLCLLEGESVIEAAWRAGYYWPTVCGGRAECTACFVEVVEGEDAAPPPDEREARQLERVRARVGGDAAVRLACCFRPSGAAVVKKKGVRPRL